MVLVVTACPAGLRGDLTKWVMEITPGVFVGDPSARVREAIWERTTELCKDGRALLIWSTNNEQGMEYRTHRHDWVPTDFDGLTLMMRPQKDRQGPKYGQRTGWSIARNARRQRNRS